MVRLFRVSDGPALCRQALERQRPGGPRGVEVGPWRVPVIKFEDDHPVGKGPERLCEVRVKGYHVPGVARPFFEA